MSRSCWQPRGPSPGPHAACLSQLACLISLFHLRWYPSGRSALVTCRILSLGVRLLPRHRCPVGSSRLVSGLSLSIDLRPIHLDLFQASSSRLATGRLNSASIRRVALSCVAVGCSRLAFGRLISVGVRPCPHGSCPAGTSQRALQQMSVLYMCAALPSVTLNTEPEHLKLKAHFSHPTSMCYWYCV